MASNQRFTEKAQEAIGAAQRETESRRLAQLEGEALLAGLLEQTDGVVPQILVKLDVDPAAVLGEVTEELDRAPRLQYSAEATVGSGLRKILQQAEQSAKQFGDDYVSTEHLLLGLLG
nr:type VI secretion system ATPase TssH [Chloroflexia bacterium]